ncbi:hypothetical protein SEA_BEEGEE_50 [Gordonia phage BeeGee]|nr:hypothetical protein SEA_BEEGEE_50 [Gordonia phage BeeGee]
MTAAVWRPTAREAYPVLGVQSFDAECADIVADLPAVGPELFTAVPIMSIEVRA